MSKQRIRYRWIAVPDNRADLELFKARYGLKDEDVSPFMEIIDGQMMIGVAEYIKLPDDPPIFDAPAEAPPPKTIPEVGYELITMLRDPETKDSDAVMKLLEFVASVQPKT